MQAKLLPLAELVERSILSNSKDSDAFVVTSDSDSMRFIVRQNKLNYGGGSSSSSSRLLLQLSLLARRALLLCHHGIFLHDTSALSKVGDELWQLEAPSQPGNCCRVLLHR